MPQPPERNDGPLLSAQLLGPRRVTLVSPDFPGTVSPAWSCTDGHFTATVDQLTYYDVLSLR